MRVLHVVATGQLRGAEVFTADLVGALGQAGVTQRVAVLRGVNSPAVDYGVPTTVLGADGWDLPGLRLRASSVRNLRREIRGWRPDVVQAHGGEPLKYAVLAGLRGGCQVVYRRIGSTPLEIRRGPRRAVYGHLMRRAARVVAVAEAVRRETLEVFRLPAPHVVTIPNGVDARRLAATSGREVVRRSLGIPAEAEVVLSLGALTWEKDPLAHVEIAAEVLAERPRAWHLIVGDGPMLDAVREAAGRSRTGERVRLVGARGDVGEVMAASDVMLFASCSEGMPATVIEAGMLGVPIAGYAVAGISEVVESGVTGLLADPDDARRLASHLLSLLRDVDRRRAMSVAARDRCQSRFDISAVAPRYLDLYRTLLGGA
jgi:glycosyltransferase involved in cell wall biosynthesis